jgi:hypothetical protein
MLFQMLARSLARKEEGQNAYAETRIQEIHPSRLVIFHKGRVVMSLKCENKSEKSKPSIMYS